MRNKRPISSADYFYIRLILQSTFSLIVMFVCSYKIMTAPETDGQKPVYWSALTATASSWLPSPVKAPEDSTTESDEFQLPKLENKPPK